MSLTVSNLNVAIEGIPILRDVSLEIPTSTMVGLIGHNGAGKTTLIRSIMGLLPTEGEMTFDGSPLHTAKSHQRAALGISYLPEDRRLIPSLTVEENILMPAWANGIPDAAKRLEWIYSLMPEIAQYRERRAMQLSGGQQKLVALGRALMPGRQMLLLDEPFEGVAPVLSRRLTEVIAELRSEGMRILLSESDDTHSSDLVDRVYRIERGVVTAS